MANRGMFGSHPSLTMGESLLNRGTPPLEMRSPADWLLNGQCDSEPLTAGGVGDGRPVDVDAFLAPDAWPPRRSALSAALQQLGTRELHLRHSHRRTRIRLLQRRV